MTSISAQGLLFDLDRAVEPGARPASIAYRGGVVAGVVLMLFAAVWSGFVVVIAEPLLAEPFPLFLFPLVFLVVGAGLLVFGLKTALTRVEAEIGADRVTLRRRDWFRSRTAEVPLAQYPGVLRRRVTYRRNKRSYQAWLAVLPHADRAKSVVLAACRHEAEARKRVEAYAAWLGLPALEETADGFEARAPEDVDKPLARLAAEGKIKTAWRPGSTPPAEIGVESSAERIVVSFLKGPLPLWLAAVVAGLGGAIAFGFVGWGADREAQIAGGGFGLLVLAGVLWVAFRGMRTRRQIVVSRDGVVIATLAKGAAEAKVEAELAIGEIEGLRVARSPLGGLALWFDTDRGSFHAGDNVPRAALDYVRDLVIAALATAEGGGQPA